MQSDQWCSPEQARKVSVAMGSLAQWCMAMDQYSLLMEVVRPKLEAVKAADERVAAMEAKAAAGQAEVAGLRSEALQLKDRSGFTSAEQQLVMKLLAEEQS